MLRASNQSIKFASSTIITCLSHAKRASYTATHNFASRIDAAFRKRGIKIYSMRKRGKLQTTIEYAAARAVIDGLGLLPRTAAVAAGRGVTRVAHTLAGGLRRTGERNLALAFPEKSARERATLLRGSFDSLGRLIGEFSQFPRHTPASLASIVDYDEEGLEHLRELRATGRGIIFLTLHLGAWEVLSFAHSALYNPLHFMVRRIDNPQVEELVEQRRTRFGNVPVDKSASVRQALRVLNEGHTLGILADLNAHQKEGVFVPFFGIPACTTAGVAMLALRTNALVLPVCAPYDARTGRYAFRYQPALEPVRTGERERDVLVNTTAYAAALERFIRTYPDQWLWIHKRWRTRPNGEPDLYKSQPDANITNSAKSADEHLLQSQ